MAKELLVGFDPVSMYVAGLERRFDGVATFCSDSLGAALIGIKWNAQVSHKFGHSLHCTSNSCHDINSDGARCKTLVSFMQVAVPHQLAVQISHAVRPVDASSNAGGTSAKKAKSGGEKQHENGAVNGQQSAAAAAVVRLVALDAAAVLEDMRAMGAGLVDEIWQKDPLSGH